MRWPPMTVPTVQSNTGLDRQHPVILGTVPDNSVLDSLKSIPDSNESSVNCPKQSQVNLANVPDSAESTLVPSQKIHYLKVCDEPSLLS